MRKTPTLFLRRYAFLIALSLCTTSLWAQTEEDARQAALHFMQQEGLKTFGLKVEKLTSQVAPLKVKAQPSVSEVNTSSNVYAFNADGGGFALVCTGNGHTVVAGYSSTGSLSASNLPTPMKNWLDNYQETLASTENSGINLKTDDPHWVGPTVTPVAPLITTKWGQSAPFNNQCPGTNKQRSKVGCVPVALAQVLHYYRLNRKGGGSLSYSHLDSETEYNINYTTTTYDWDNMLDTYEEGKYTKVQADAVAKLMLECGIACKADFGYTATSSQSAFVALNNYYNFECQNVIRSSSIQNIYTLTGFDFLVATEKWMKMIQEELTHGRPIIYTAGTQEHPIGGINDPDNDIVHTFIIDGIDDKNYVHVNWGWGGMADGYYDVAVLNPSVIRFDDVKGFRRNHSMILGIQPREEDFQEKVYQTFVPCIYSSDNSPGIQHSPEKRKDYSMHKQQMRPFYTTSKYNFYLTSNTYKKKKFKVSIALVKDGKIVYDFQKGEFNLLSLEGTDTHIYNLIGSFGSVPQVDDGTYELRIIYRDQRGQTQITPMPSQYVSQVEISRNSQKMRFINTTNDSVVNTIFIDEVTPASEIYAGTKFYLNVKAHGYYGGGYNSFKLNFRNEETGKVYGYYQGANSLNDLSYTFDYNDYTQSKIFPFFPKSISNGFGMPAGRYKVEVAKENGVRKFAKIVGNLYIDVKEKPSYPVLDGISLASLDMWFNNEEEKQYAELGYFPISNTENWKDLTCEFAYANKTDDPVTLRLYLVNVNTGEEIPIHQQENWSPGQKVNINQSFYPLQGLYVFRCRYVTPDGEREGLIPDSYYDKTYYSKIWSYRYDMGKTHDFLDEYLSQLSKVTSHRIDSSHVSISLSIKPLYSWPSYNKASAKLLLVNKKTGNLSIVVKKGIEMENESATTINFIAPLASDAEYEGWALYKKSEDDDYYYVINRDGEFARFTILKDGSLVGISQAQTPSTQAFSVGENIKVFDVKGNLLFNTTFSSNLWSELDRTLPHGVYIIKSASQSVKFGK